MFDSPIPAAAATRLPPQPTDTRLARAVAATLGRSARGVGAARKWAGRNLRFVTRGRHDDLQARCDRLAGDVSWLCMRLDHLEEDYQKFLPDVSPYKSPYKIRASADVAFDEWDQQYEVRSRVAFEPSTIVSPLPVTPVRKGAEIHQATTHVLSCHARSLAQRYVDQIARDILHKTAPRATYLAQEVQRPRYRAPMPF